MPAGGAHGVHDEEKGISESERAVKFCAALGCVAEPDKTDRNELFMFDSPWVL